MLLYDAATRSLCNDSSGLAALGVVNVWNLLRDLVQGQSAIIVSLVSLSTDMKSSFTASSPRASCILTPYNNSLQNFFVFVCIMSFSLGGESVCHCSRFVQTDWMHTAAQPRLPRHTPHSTSCVISADGSPYGSVVTQVYQDMTRPLSQYFISVSEKFILERPLRQ